MKRFEEKLAENIARAFDSYQEPVDAQAFAQLQARLRERRRRRFWLPLYFRLAGAAAVLGIAGLAWALWPAQLHESALGPQPTAAADAEGVPSSQPAPSATAHPSSPPGGLEIRKRFVPVLLPPSLPARQPAHLGRAARGGEGLLATTASQAEWHESADGAKLPAAEMARLEETGIQDSSAGPEGLSASAGQQPQALAALPAPERVSQQSAVDDAGADSKGLGSGLPLVEPARRRGGLELLASAGGNIAELQLARGMGWRAGVLYHRPLSASLSLSSGLLLAHNRMSFAPNSRRDMLQIETLNPNQTASSTQQDVFDRQIAARYSSLELPLNLRYAWRQKSGKHWQVSLGLSSLWYLRQAFELERDIVTTSIFQDPGNFEPTIRIERETALVQERPAAFRTIDVAGLVNAAIAFPLDLGGRPLWIEPYLQVPTGRLTDRQFAFGSGGISLKYALSKPK